VKTFKLGDRAGIKPMMDTCGSCALCWDDKETEGETQVSLHHMDVGRAKSGVVQLDQNIVGAFTGPWVSPSCRRSVCALRDMKVRV
jgi:D-arabinose 1-dehydrogenase-like Zn-dependent alcohol dehydrogenase